MPENTLNNEWTEVVAIIRDALPGIDKALSRANIPLSTRKRRAFDLVKEHMVEASDWEKFLVSESYARLMALVNDWYRERYGDALDVVTDKFPSLVVIYDSPFPFYVPLRFLMPGDEKGTRWVGFPASVQNEEDPLEWIVNGPSLDKLEPLARDELFEEALKTANAIRSINFDLETLHSDTQDIHRDLAAAVLVNLRSAAQRLCSQEKGSLRDAGWQLCQAVEKTLKLYIHRKGDTPKKTHELADLADHAEKISAIKIDRSKLGTIPSGKRATNLRYNGAYTIKEGLTAYRASLEIIKELASVIQIKGKLNIREARFLLKTPPWFSYDTQSFLTALKSAGKNNG